MLANVQPRDLDLPGNLASVVMRRQPAQEAQQGGLARTGAPRDHHHLPRLDLQVDLVKAARLGAGVAIVEGLDPDQGLAHRRRLRARVANGNAATSGIEAASTRVAGSMSISTNG